MPSQLIQMVEELKRCEAGGAHAACVVLIYVYIDTLAYIGMPSSKTANDRSDFKSWVDRYLKADPRQSYQYRSKDVYAARCAMLHTFSSEADIHLRDEDTMAFGYHDGGRHAVDAKIHSNLVMVGIASLVDDFIRAVVSFLGDLEKRTTDPSEKLVIETRLSKTLGIVPFNSGDPG